jgi:twitching motility protein PilT
MSEFIRDPDLNRLVQELNSVAEPDRPRSDEAAGAFPLSSVSVTSDVSADTPLQRLLMEMKRRKATDLILLTSVSPVFRVGGELQISDFVPLLEDDLQAMFAPHVSRSHAERLTKEGSTDFSIRLSRDSSGGGARFRVNLHRQRGTMAASVRMLPARVPTLSELGHPAVFAELAAATRGLVLVCGPTGSGKSTTLAAMVNEINRLSPRHVITIEDPIEYEHGNQRSVIEQIEIGRDASTFAAALRSSLRQDPDVILVGEMRDLETASTALTAAETGHLVLSTLHTSDVAQAIHRIIDVFPGDQQSQVRQQLALAVSAIVCQQLVPRIDGQGRVAVFEILLANYAVRNHIRRDKLQNLYSEITLGRRNGMATLEESLGALVRKGVISVEEARMRANKPEELEAEVRGRGNVAD